MQDLIESQANAWLFFTPPQTAANLRNDILTNTFGGSRKRAEAAFGKTQSLARNRTISEIDAVAQARDEKTNRLRALRLAKEAGDIAAAPAPEKAKRSGN